MESDQLRDQLLEKRRHLSETLADAPYDAITYLERAVVYSDLGYPDLAAGDAYRALLLTDEVLNDGLEYHSHALDALSLRADVEQLPTVLMFGNLASRWDPTPSHDRVCALAELVATRAYQILSLSLLLCGCLKSAAVFCERGLKASSENQELLNVQGHIKTFARRKLGRDEFDIEELPDKGLVRREVYPWNTHEADRYNGDMLDIVNSDMRPMAPKCEVKVASLPVLLEGASETDDYDVIPTCQQLGVFATEDIEPGEVVLKEYSILTANNRLKDSVCDACSEELPPLGSEEQAVNCDDCYDTVFCSQYCHDQAQRRYHPALCDKDGVDSIAKDGEAHEADDTLYLLLLARVFALATHQSIHPLDCHEVRFIWGDFVPSATNDINPSPNAGPPPEWTLPFSFKYNIETPLHILENMDIDIYATASTFDLWVLNTLYAKFRGTASARKSPRDGRPDVAAVHTYWCLANHDCDPNVTWEWGGRMVLKARETRADGRPGGIKKGEEILNHYCDIDLPVQQRREWASGSLGGWCMCKRCRVESGSNGAVENGQGETN